MACRMHSCLSQAWLGNQWSQALAQPDSTAAQLHCSAAPHTWPAAGGCGRKLPVEFRLLRAPRVFSLQVGLLALWQQPSALLWVGLASSPASGQHHCRRPRGSVRL